MEITNWRIFAPASLDRWALSGDVEGGNGIVDAAGYTVWRDFLGRTGIGLAADGNGNGTIDAGDFEVWKTHFGSHSGVLVQIPLCPSRRCRCC